MDGPLLLTGASGLLGHWLLATRPSEVTPAAMVHRREVAGVDTVHADLRDPDVVRRAVRGVEPALVLHAAYAKDRVSIVDATRHVVEAADGVGADVLLTSTDAVFHGDGLQRDETAVPDATWDYGRWKAAAERIVLSAGGTVVRLPLLVSLEPDDPAASKIRAAAADGSSSDWYVDEFRKAALASEVAEAVWRIAMLGQDERRGTWHLAGTERLSRYEIARRLATSMGVSAVAPNHRPPDSDRPCDIAFTDARARATVGWNPNPIP